jgi:hypothetical protein
LRKALSGRATIRRNGPIALTIVRAARFIVNRFCSAFLRFLRPHSLAFGMASQKGFAAGFQV